MIKKILLSFTVLLIARGTVCNFYDLYDPFIYLPMINKKNKNIVWIQSKTHYKNMHAYDDNGKKQQPFQLFSTYQNALAALEGFPADSIQGQKLNQIDVISDGVRGTLLLEGSLKMDWSVIGGVVIPFSKHWSYHSFIGAYHFSLNNVAITDQTRNQSIDDFKTKQLLTNDIKKNAQLLGTGLLLQDWNRTGLGDWMNYVVWEKEFEQERLLLQAVKLSLRVGLGLPVGNKTDPDLFFAYSYGNDGSVTLPFGARLHCSINDYFSYGLDFELMYLFGRTRPGRLKISADQTEPLLFAKELLYKEPGMQQRLDIYAQISDCKKRFFLTAGYHYHKKGDDTITIQRASFSNSVANRAVSLQDSTAHHVIIAGAVDSSDWFETVSIQSNISIKVPFNGSNRLVGNSIGFGFGINF